MSGRTELAVPPPASPPAPTISVVVASFRARTQLERCLDALAPQCQTPDVELIVARTREAGDADLIARHYPGARVIQAAPGADLPRVRGTGLAAAGGALVALTEDHCAPAGDWVARLRTHVGAPRDVVGGAMDNARTERRVDWGAYFSEYGFFAGGQGGDVPLVTGANVAYARAVVGDVAEWALGGAWENVCHARLAERGARFAFDPELRVAQVLTYRVGAFCLDRYEHGRDYARTRVREERVGGVRRLARAASTPLLPGLLAWRVGRGLSRAEHRSAFPGALPFTLLFLSAWSAGELVGYLRGPVR